MRCGRSGAGSDAGAGAGAGAGARVRRRRKFHGQSSARQGALRRAWGSESSKSCGRDLEPGAARRTTNPSLLFDTSIHTLQYVGRSATQPKGRVEGELGMFILWGVTNNAHRGAGKLSASTSRRERGCSRCAGSQWRRNCFLTRPIGAGFELRAPWDTEDVRQPPHC